jgi:hypothetical protein
VSGHDDIRDLIGAVALGAATPGEHDRVERHAATCHECRAELDGLRAAASTLALDVPQLEPPAALRRKVMAAVRDDAERNRRPAPSRPRRGLALWPALAGALAVLAGGLAAWNVTLQGDRGANSTVVFAGTAEAPAAAGRLIIDDEGTAVMRITGLPALPSDQGYELWTVRNGVPRSEGFAARTASGEVVVATADLDGASALALTPEPRSNTTAPTGAKLVVVPV